jgi:hypothetical protein
MDYFDKNWPSFCAANISVRVLDPALNPRQTRCMLDGIRALRRRHQDHHGGGTVQRRHVCFKRLSRMTEAALAMARDLLIATSARLMLRLAAGADVIFFEYQ